MPNEPIHVRPMRAGEAGRVTEITRECPEAAQWKEADYANLVRGESWNGAGACVLVAEVDSTVAGFVAARVVAEELEILNLGVTPAQRRRGVGAALFIALFEAAAGSGAKAAFCEVRESNVHGRSFYAYHGFAQTGRRLRYYKDPVEDALVLAKGLRSPL